MNYIEQITKYLTDHKREDEIPFVLLSAKIQGRQHWESNNHRNTYGDECTVEQLEYLDVNALLHWSATNEGFDYWVAIHDYSGVKYGRG